MGNNYRFGIDDRVAKRLEFREILKEERAEYRGYKPTSKSNTDEPEFQSIESFVQFMIDEADDNGKVPQFTAEQTEKLSEKLKITIVEVVNQLKLFGLEPAPRSPVKNPRGYRSVENKWAQNPSFACSGQDQISGFAGPKQSKISSRRVPSRVKPTERPDPFTTPADVRKEQEQNRLQLIRNGEQNRRETERLHQVQCNLMAEQMLKIIKRQRLIDMMHAEVAVIEDERVMKKKIDRCVRFIRLATMHREHLGEEYTVAIADDFTKVKTIFNGLIG